MTRMSTATALKMRTIEEGAGIAVRGYEVDGAEWLEGKEVGFAVAVYLATVNGGELLFDSRAGDAVGLS